MGDERSRFEASASALGYAYQFRYALFRALEQRRFGLNWSIAIEAADDVELTVHEGQIELRQLKLRQKGTTLGNADTDLWKTIRIWAEALEAGKIDLTTHKLYLVTTARVTANSVGAMLASDESSRNPTAARSALDEVIRTSTNESNLKAYVAYRALSSQQRNALLQAIHVIPQSDDIESVRTRLVEAIRVGLREQHIDAILERLEGWWFQKCIECMKYRSSIHAADIENFTADLRDRFGPTALPIDKDIVNVELGDVSEFTQRVFYRQIELAQISAKRIQIAVRDYLRAATQRSRWSRIGLLMPGEIEDYERRLKEEWEIVFERLKDDLGAEAAEEEKVRIAKKIYA